jgi:hypothetical protein
MTLTLDLTPEAEAALEAEAARTGQSAQDFAARLFAEALEDAIDLADAQRVMASSDPAKRVPWPDVKARLGL